jgi:hypothetical protein
VYAYYKACLVKIVHVVVLDTILSFGILYKAELALDKLRIFTEGSPVVVLSSKLYLKLWLTLYKSFRLGWANRVAVAGS